jgi:hypothetical protein
MTTLLRIELASLRRSRVLWLAALLVVGGSLVARMLTWVSRALGRSELGVLLWNHPSVGWSDVAIPLMLLAYLIVTAYAFGRDFEDGTVDLVLTAPVRREAVVLARMTVVAACLVVLSLVGWLADVALHAVLATSSLDPGGLATPGAVLGASVAGVATLPLVAWAAIRFRGVLPALGLGIAIQVAVLALAGLATVQLLPWFLPLTLASGGSALWYSFVLAFVLFLGGLVATLGSFRTVDLYE